MKKAVSLGAMIVAGLMLSSSVALAASDQSAGRVDAAARNMQKFLGSTTSSLAATDPDLAAMRDRLLYGEIMDHGTLSDKQRMLVTLVVQNYLSAFCFGDIYTRKGLDLKTRELLTFSIISAFGGCDSQVRSHVQGNIAVGNTRENLIDALAQSLPYMGFPRTLNALACVNAVAPAAGK